MLSHPFSINVYILIITPSLFMGITLSHFPQLSFLKPLPLPSIFWLMYSEGGGRGWSDGLKDKRAEARVHCGGVRRKWWQRPSHPGWQEHLDLLFRHDLCSRRVSLWGFTWWLYIITWSLRPWWWTPRSICSLIISQLRYQKVVKTILWSATEQCNESMPFHGEGGRVGTPGLG